MFPIELGDAVALASIALTIVVTITSFWQQTRSDSAMDSAKDQRNADQLSRIEEVVESTRDEVREINRKLGDHGDRITKLEQQNITIFHRLERVEGSMDICRKGAKGHD